MVKALYHGTEAGQPCRRLSDRQDPSRELGGCVVGGKGTQGGQEKLGVAVWLIPCDPGTYEAETEG